MRTFRFAMAAMAFAAVHGNVQAAPPAPAMLAVSSGNGRATAATGANDIALQPRSRPQANTDIDGNVYHTVTIPLVNIIVGIIAAVALAAEFGKGVGFAIGMIFLPFIFYPILAFSDAQYTA